MLGTDLNAAYYNVGYVPNNNGYINDSNTGNNATAPTYTNNDGPIAVSMPTQQPKQQNIKTEQQPPVYDPVVPVSESQLSDPMLQELQLELLRQSNNALNNTTKQQASATPNTNTSVPPNSESIIDRYASKKKDVFKLINISFSVLLAISIHFVVVDIVKTYIRNNDFTYNKETYIKCMYPISVLLIMWSFKVFNK